MCHVAPLYVLLWLRGKQNGGRTGLVVPGGVPCGIGTIVLSHRKYLLSHCGVCVCIGRLGDHEAGVLLASSLTVVNNTVANGMRTITVTRSFEGISADHFTFNALANSVPYINALGATPDLSYHRNKSTGSAYFVELDGPTCVCNMAADQGTIGVFAWGAQRCTPRPSGQMLDDPYWPDNNFVNPTCLLKSYVGGLRCCKGGTVLLDSDQAGTYNDTVDAYQLKYRYYYEAGSPEINDYQWTFWWTEHDNNEHDVPPCSHDPNHGENGCVYEINSNFTAGEIAGFDPSAANGTITLIHVEGHCHIGCLGMELWIMDDPEHPQLLCKTNVVYGLGDEAHNEMGYILGNEPCIFGRPEDGFEAPILLHADTKLMSIKYQNNTVARYGDMALWEIGAAYPKA